MSPKSDNSRNSGSIQAALKKKSTRAPEIAKDVCSIVVMGASAGGLEAFERFFEHMPCDTGIAFILIQHLDPHHETLIPELLSKHTDMKVEKIVDNLKVEPNRIYVVPQNVKASMVGCEFCITPMNLGVDRNLIDHCFESVADDRRENIIGIVLSGTGIDGTMGLKAIKENGGLTIAQLPESAGFDAMPRSAITSGFVDFVLKVEEMPAKIIEYVDHLKTVQNRKMAERIQKEAVKFLPKIFPILRAKTGHDFSDYKQSTLVRRIQRRMHIIYVDSVEKYVRRLLNDSDEVDALFKDLLIGVTQFFRDHESFDLIEKKVVPEMFKGKGPEDTVRVWIPGCASGEEAYSFAIMLQEYAASVGAGPKIQIFATDLDTNALEFARKAKYDEDTRDQVPAKYLKKYFTRTNSGYEVNKEIRELCIFSPHNLIKDPPFSRQDLISCRNLLIYMETELQRKLLPLFHYALNPSGYLFLGPSESIANRSELFRTIDQKHRIFQRKPTLLHSPVQMPLIDLGRVTKLQPAGPQLVVQKEQNLARMIERVILEEFSPPSVVINELGDVMFFSGNLSDYLEPMVGVPNNKLVNMARKNLRLELRMIIKRAVSVGSEMVRENVPFKIGSEVHAVKITVRPLPELGKESNLFIVIFEKSPITSKPASPVTTEDFTNLEHPVIKQLENELRITKENLQTTVEELETSNEELKSANEELLSMNEELQSSNEELQTSKEEVQSTNEELQKKIQELDRLNEELRGAHEGLNRLASIVESSDDAILSKNLDGTITSWNNSAERIFGYKADEMIGQTIYKIIPKELHEEESRILNRVRVGERIGHYQTVRLRKDGQRVDISLSVAPIFNPDGKIVGISKIARDISIIKRVQDIQARLAAIVENSDDGIIGKTLDGIITSWNKGARKILGYTSEEMVGQSILKIIPDELKSEEDYILGTLRKGNSIEHYETIRQTKDGRRINVSLTSSPIRNPEGKIIGVSKILRDVTAQKKNEEALKKALTFDDAVMSNMGEGLFAVDTEGKVTFMNPAGEKLLGWNFQELQGRKMHEVTHYKHRDGSPFPAEDCAGLQLLKTGRKLHDFEDVFIRKDGTFFDVVYSAAPIQENNQTTGLVVVFRDVTERKKVTEALKKSHSQFVTLVEQSPVGILLVDEQLKIQQFNDRATPVFGDKKPKAGEPLRSSIEHLFPTHIINDIVERYKHTLKTGESYYSREIVHPVNGSSERHYQWEIHRILLMDGQMGIVCYFLDISTHIVAQQSLQKAKQEVENARAELEERIKERTAELTLSNKELKRSNEELETFAYVSSHDLQEPLRMIGGYTQLLERYYTDGNSEAKEYMHYVVDGVARMQQLIQDLLTFSRIRSGRNPTEQVDFNKVVETVKLNIQARIKSTGARVTHDPLPTVIADESRINQLIQNLVSNALKFHRDEPPQVHISATHQDGEWIFSVRDNGIGIDPKYFDQIFVIFQRLHSRDKFEGTGMGLAICKKIVEQLDGKMWLESEVGKGTTFYFSIPDKLIVTS